MFNINNDMIVWAISIIFTCTCICVHVHVHVYVHIHVHVHVHVHVVLLFASSYNKLLLLLFTMNLSCHRVVYVNNYNSFTWRNVFRLVILLTIQHISQYLVCRMHSCNFLSFFLVFDNASSSA